MITRKEAHRRAYVQIAIRAEAIGLGNVAMANPDLDDDADVAEVHAAVVEITSALQARAARLA